MSVDGKAITYSESNPLNPKTYDGKTFEFEGRRLVKVSSGSMVATYKYDDTGLRTEKTVTKNGVATTTKFVYNGGKLIAEYTGTKRVDYLYDENGMLYGFIYNNAKYFYIRDTLQNILGIVDANGNAVVHYNYTAYGECKAITGSKASTIGTINSFRYKGYYFDAETGLYYVSSRYYDPEIGRCINADIPETLTADFENFAQYNLFAYCFNDPVNLSDETGTWPSWATKLAIGVRAVVIGAAVVAATAASGGAAAAFVGAAVAGLKAAAVSGAIGAAVGAGTSAVSYRVSTGGWSGAGKAAVDGAVDGFANGFMTGGILAGGSQILSSGFKVAANAGVPTGRNGGLTMGNKVRVLSPNHPQAYEAGGTLLKIGSKYKNIRFDVGSNSLFHMNIQLAKTANYHIPIGMFGAGLWGGIARD